MLNILKGFLATASLAVASCGSPVMAMTIEGPDACMAVANYAGTVAANRDSIPLAEAKTTIEQRIEEARKVDPSRTWVHDDEDRALVRALLVEAYKTKSTPEDFALHVFQACVGKE